MSESNGDSFFWPFSRRVKSVLLTSFISKSKRLIDRGLHQVLPRVCSLCEQNLEGDQECASRLCEACEERLPGQHALRCLRCGMAHLPPFDAKPLQVSANQSGCALDQRERFPWDGVVAWLDYEYPVDGWVHALKFQKEASLAHGLGWGLAQAVMRAPPELQNKLAQLDGLIPLPLSTQRLAKRGFNQAQLIAQSLRIALPENGFACDSNQRARTPKAGLVATKLSLHLNILRRTKDGPAMSLQASEGRHHLVKDAYEVPIKKSPLASSRSSPGHLPTHLPLAGLRLGLVDDVMTTGATLSEATRCLKAAGAAEVIVLVAARTPSPLN